MKVGLLGAGRIGKVHGKAIADCPGVQLSAVYDYDGAAAEALAQENNSKAVQNPQDIFADQSLDAVLICTPTDTHADYIKQAIDAKKAVFCEKPVDLSTKIVRDIVHYVDKNHVKLMIGFNRRFDPNFIAVHQAVTSGQLGAVEIVQITSRDPGAPPIDYVKRSGGMLRDMTIHDFDMARFLMGTEFSEIFAYGGAIIDPEIGKAGDIDSAVVVLKTAQGQMAQISNSRRASYGYDQRIEVHGAKAMASASNVHENLAMIADNTGFHHAPLQNFFMSRYTTAYRNEINHFAQSVRMGHALTPSGYDGLRAQELADAALESLNSGKSVKL